MGIGTVKRPENHPERMLSGNEGSFAMNLHWFRRLLWDSLLVGVEDVVSMAGGRCIFPENLLQYVGFLQS